MSCFIQFSVLLVSAFVCIASPIHAQAENSPTEAEDRGSTSPPAAAEESWKFRKGASALEVEAGFAPNQPTFMSGPKDYDTDGRKFVMASVKWSRVLGTPRFVTYQYFVDVMPVAIAVRNETRNGRFRSKKETPDEPPTFRRNTFGFAVQPVGFRFLFRPHSRIKRYGQVSAGLLVTTKPFPTPDGTSLNMVGDFGGGVMYSLDRRLAINFGYRYFQVSNLYIGDKNPGYNANVFFVGVSRFYK